MARAVLDPAPAMTLRETAVGYTTFSPRLASSLTAAGGLLAIVGGLGLWVRAVALTTSGIHQTATVTGFGHASGWFIAALGCVAVAGMLVRYPRIRLVAAAASVAAPLGEDPRSVLCRHLRRRLVVRAGRSRLGSADPQSLMFVHVPPIAWLAWPSPRAANSLASAGSKAIRFIPPGPAQD